MQYNFKAKLDPKKLYTKEELIDLLDVSPRSSIDVLLENVKSFNVHNKILYRGWIVTLSLLDGGYQFGA